MKKLLGIALLAVGALFVSSCGSDDSTTTTIVDTLQVEVIEGGLGVLVTSNITSDVTWSSDSIYVLDDRIAVESGATLTIEAGTIIKGNAGTGANATALIVAQGATLNAAGTASNPIIFTSRSDEISVSDVAAGNFASPNLSDDVDGLWGGLIVLGNARISTENDTGDQLETTNIEGIPATDANGLYGGTADDDNSGTITYVSCRHGGSNIGEGNEINGITFGGVGTGTTISHIEVVATQDDGIEMFGGTVDIDNVVILNNGDDAIDTDQAYAGTIDNFVIINPGDKGFELDGPEGDYAGAGHTITNGTVYMQDCAGGYDDDSSTDAIVNNVYFTDLNEDTGTSNDYNVNGLFVATDIELDNTFDDDDGNPVAVTVADYFGDMDGLGIVTLVNPGENTVGADESEFAGWSFTSDSGNL